MRRSMDSVPVANPVLRIAFARKLGFKAAEMDDECGSIVVLPEFITLEVATEEDDEEED